MYEYSTWETRQDRGLLGEPVKYRIERRTRRKRVSAWEKGAYHSPVLQAPRQNDRGNNSDEQGRGVEKDRIQWGGGDITQGVKPLNLSEYVLGTIQSTLPRVEYLYSTLDLTRFTMDVAYSTE